MSQAAKPLVIWRVVDGKPGHESQSLGLVQSLQSMHDCRVVDYPCPRSWWWWLFFLLKWLPKAPNAPAPDVVVAAGHRTHWAALTLKRKYGAFTVVLMKPSLPLRCFDAVIAPVHDGLSGDNVICTEGALNPMRPGTKQPGSVLLLVGGPSKHFLWSDASVWAQIQRLQQHYPGLRVSNSRRTPEAISKQLASSFGDQFVPWQSCPPGWLAAELAVTEQVWVSEDSVSMIYEALSASCRVGLVSLRRPTKQSRLVRGLDVLVRDGRIARWSDGVVAALLPVNAGLQEASRVASILWQRLIRNGFRLLAEGNLEHLDKKVMKIALVMAGQGMGGLEKHVIELADGLGVNGHQVSVISHKTFEKSMPTNVAFFSVNLARGRYNILALWQLRCALKASGAQLVHAHGSKAASMVGLLLPWLGMASVATLHSRKKQTAMFRPFQRVIAVSRISTMNLDHVGVRIIHNGISPPEQIDQPVVDPWSGLSGGPKVLAVGRLVPVKGFDVLLEAWRNIPADLVIAGEGFERAKLEALIEELGLKGRARLLGHRSDVTSLMAAADLFVISSHYEGCPYTLVEALHMRLPVVSTAVGAMPEILPSEWLCRPDNIGDLAQLLLRSLADLSTIRECFQPIFLEAATSLTFSKLLSETELVYREAIEETKVR